MNHSGRTAGQTPPLMGNDARQALFTWPLNWNWLSLWMARQRTHPRQNSSVPLGGWYTPSGQSAGPGATHTEKERIA